MLEAVLQENTSVMRELIAALRALPLAPAAPAKREKKTPPAPEPAVQAIVTTNDASSTPGQTSLPAEAAAQEPPAVVGQAAPAGERVVGVNDVREVLLRVIAKDRSAAVAALKKAGGERISDVPAQALPGLLDALNAFLGA